MAENQEHYMRLALDEARKAGEAGNRAVGAVVVRGDEVIGLGGNRRDSANDPTGHAEITALHDAVTKMRNLDFSDCTIYTTLEPCPMCCGAIAVNNIPVVVVGMMHTGGERRWGDYTVHKLIDLVDQGNRIVTGVLAVECGAVLHEWDVQHGRA